MQADDAEECASCGVVFARFREAQERALLARRSTMSQPVPVESGGGVPRALVIVGLVFVLAFGVIWTAKRREARAKYDPHAAASAMLDDINQKGLKTRQRLQEEADRAERLRNQAPIAQTAPPQRPIGFSEETATQVLNQCSGFNTAEQVLLPKGYSDFTRASIHDQYPALGTAVRDKIVEVTVEDGVYKVTVPDTAHFRMTIREDETHYVIPLGRRRVTAIRNLTGTADKADARFEFTFEERVAGEILVQPYTNFHGHATFVRKNNIWQALNATTTTQDYVVDKNLCP